MNFRDQPENPSLGDGPPTRRVRRNRSGDGVLSIRPFRALWVALSLSSLGDWLSILALTELAANLTKSGVAQNSAVGGVWVVTLLPALLLGPIAGALADKFDRRVTMIVGDIIRGLLFLSIPLFPNLTWIFVAKFLAGVTSQFWNPAAAASVPNLVPREKLERANQLSQLMTYGTAPLAAGAFAVLTYAANGLGHVAPIFRTNNVDLALYFNAASYLVSAVTVYFLRQIGKREHSGRISVPSTAKAIWEGWRFIGQTPVVRGLVIGMLGAFSAAGVVVGLAVPYIKSTLRGGSAGWALVFAAIFVGMALGMGFGSRLFGQQFSRRRLFGLTLTVSAVPLALIGLVPNLDLLVVFVLLMGFTSGIAYPTGFTIVGLEVDDDTRGRVFAFFQSTIQVILLAVIAVAPFIAGGLTAAIQAITGARNGDVRVWHINYASAGQNLLFLLSALLVAYVGIKSYRELDDRKGVPLREDLVAALRGEDMRRIPDAADGDEGIDHGLFVAFEGGEGSGKTTQARQLAIWLREQGYEVVTTHEPGATKIGMRLRALLLDRNHAGLSPRAEALMYAADRAEHVQSVIEPALARDAVVITDRYVDSSLAYQGAGRGLRNSEIERLNRWATGGRMPDLTVLLDMPPEGGLNRRTVSADRLEAEPLEFHRRVRAGFLALARAESSRYLLVDATQSQEEVARVIRERVQEILPDPVPRTAEAVTSSFPAIS